MGSENREDKKSSVIKNHESKTEGNVHKTQTSQGKKKA